MKNLTVLMAVLLLAATMAAATVSYYTDQAIFEGLYPGLTTEDYSGTLIASNSIQSDFGPLNSTTNNLLFAPGAIVDGFSFDNLDSGDNVILTPPFAGVTSVTVGPNAFSHSSEYSFSVPVNAFGIEIVMPMTAGSVAIEVFGASGSLGTITSRGDLPGIFWGVYSDEEIIKIEFIEPVDNGELFANAQFGAVLALENTTWGYIKTAF